MAITVVGLMENYDDAQDAVQELVDSGFNRDSIGLMASDKTGGSAEIEAQQKAERGEDTAAGAMKGAGAGAALGGAAGLLVGLAALPIPGIGPIIAAGPIAAALAGAGVGAVAGGGIGALTNLGIPEHEADTLAEGIRRGGTLVTVSADDDDMADKAVEIMRDHGAIDIDERSRQWKSSGWTGSGAANQEELESAPPQGEEEVIPVVKEELQVGKRQVERGGVRVFSHVIERPVEETVQLQEEHVDVERRPVDRPISAAGEEAFQEQTFEVRETEEQPVVEKQARVVEEVVIGKETTAREETIRDTVRETEVDIERTGEPSEMEAMRSRRAYQGPERRRSSSPYSGIERRAA